MTQSHEFNAATVDEALAKASEKLDMPVERIVYEVVDEGSPGFLGIGARDARISVSKDETGERNLGAPKDTTQEEDRDLDQGSEMAVVSAESDAEPVELTSGQELEASFEASEDLLSEVKEFTTSVVSGMGFEPSIDVYDAGEFIAVDVSPGDTGLFIGQKGETIDAVQHLVNISTYRDREFVKRIIIDSEGYRQRRIEAVQGMAHRMARRAAREGRIIELPPMNSSERRIVHTYLKENPDVSTDSEGTGENRRVNISPVQ